MPQWKILPPLPKTDTGTAETITGAAIAALIGFISGFLAVMAQDDVAGVADFAEATWWFLIGGAALSFLKDYQSISTRNLLSKMRKDD